MHRVAGGPAPATCAGPRSAPARSAGRADALTGPRSAVYHRRRTAMTEFLLGSGFTIVCCMLITLVFAIALLSMVREFTYVRALADYLGYDLLVHEPPGRAGADRDRPPRGDQAGPAAPRPGARPGAAARAPASSLLIDAIRDEVHAVASADDPAWASKQIRGWQMRVQRLESALAFWCDLLRQLGLLGTVVGLGFSLAFGEARPEALLGPLALAVWTTVFGLAYSIWLSAQFGIKLPAWVDVCEKNIEAWSARQRSAEAR
jgi:hypothetical protein